MLTHFLFTWRGGGGGGFYPAYDTPSLLVLLKWGRHGLLTPIHPSTKLTLQRGCFVSGFSRFKGVQRNSPSSHPSRHDLNAVKHDQGFLFFFFLCIKKTHLHAED
jgi:hypothetical protein